MTLLGIADFSGMLPIRDPTLLPDNNAQHCHNTWMYRGTLRGLRISQSVYTLKRPNTTKQVFRIPLNNVLEDWVNSLWLEFPDPYMKVIRNPVVGDQYNRYYFFPSDEFVDDGSGWPSTPFYATLDNIQAGGPYYSLGIPAPDIAPLVVAAPDSITHNARHPSDLYAIAVPPNFDPAFMALDSVTSIVVGMEVDDTTITTLAHNTVALAPVDTIGLTFAKTYDGVGGPTDVTQIQYGMTVTNLTNPSSIAAGTVVVGTNATIVNLSYPLLADVQISDTIQFVNANQIPGSTTVERILTGTPTHPQVKLSGPVANAGVLVNDHISFTDIIETRSYLYTYVSAYGEEGSPSPATTKTGGSSGTWVITVYSPSDDDLLNRNINRIRIYRTVTDSQGSATFYQIKELPITTPGAAIVYSDSATPDDVADGVILNSTLYTGPPEGLQGVVMMANGIMAGWTNERELWFSTAFLPHSWPSTFALTVDFPVVGIAAVGSSLSVMTQGQPFIATGVTPDTMTIGKITANDPCVARGSIFAAGEGVYYASPNGLILLNTSGTANVTMQFMELEFWNSLNPELFAAGRLGSNYFAFKKGIKPVDEDDHNGMVFNNIEKNVSFSYIHTSLNPVVNLYWDELTGQIFYLADGVVRWINPPSGGSLLPYHWISKSFRLPKPGVLKAFYVSFNIPDEITIPAPNSQSRNTDQAQIFNQTKQYLIVRVYAGLNKSPTRDPDNLVVVREVISSQEVLTIPGGFKAEFWTFELEGQVDIQMMKMSDSIKELGKA